MENSFLINLFNWIDRETVLPEEKIFIALIFALVGIAVIALGDK